MLALCLLCGQGQRAAVYSRDGDLVLAPPADGTVRVGSLVSIDPATGQITSPEIQTLLLRQEAQGALLAEQSTLLAEQAALLDELGTRNCSCDGGTDASPPPPPEATTAITTTAAAVGSLGVCAATAAADEDAAECGTMPAGLSPGVCDLHYDEGAFDSRGNRNLNCNTLCGLGGGTCLGTLGQAGCSEARETVSQSTPASVVAACADGHWEHTCRCEPIAGPVVRDASWDYDDSIEDRVAAASVTAVGGYVKIRGIANLVALGGFGRLQTVGAEMQVQNCPALNSVSGFAALTQVGGDLNFNRNNALHAIRGFEALRTVRNTLDIEDQELLTTIDGFRALETAGYLDIFGNPHLTSVGSFGSLRTLRGIRVAQNERLHEVAPFSSLVAICGGVTLIGAGSNVGRLPQRANRNMRWDADYHFPVLQCIREWNEWPGVRPSEGPNQPTLRTQLEAREGFRVGDCVC